MCDSRGPALLVTQMSKSIMTSIYHSCKIFQISHKYIRLDLEDCQCYKRFALVESIFCHWKFYLDIPSQMYMRGLWWCWQQRSMLHTELWSPPGFAFVTLALLHILDLLWLHFPPPFYTNLVEVVKIYGLHRQFSFTNTTLVACTTLTCCVHVGWLLKKCLDLIG